MSIDSTSPIKCIPHEKLHQHNKQFNSQIGAVSVYFSLSHPIDRSISPNE